jgi:malonyl CoA-acyl carrier protein transacylase
MRLPNTSTVVLFPGQGVSLVGARGFVQSSCAELYGRCCELLGADPFERCAESTRFAQPAVFLASVAGWRTLAVDAPLALAGHSLGELAALAAAEALTFEDALSLAIVRGELMAEAAEGHRGGMVAVLKGTAAQASVLAHSHGLVIANDNAPGQLILSGPLAALEAASEEARAGHGLRTMRLDVKGAFHSPAMELARGPFLAAVRRVSIVAPRIPVFSGLTAAPFLDIQTELAEALVRPVRWRETMAALDALGAERYVDVGPDRVLARLAARNLSSVEVAVEAVEDLRAVRA